MPTERQYWDSCCFLAIINDEADRILHLRPLWHDASGNRNSQILTSALTIAECSHPRGTAEEQTALDRFFADRCLTLIANDRLVAQDARDLQRQVRERFGRRLPVRDSIHLASALRGNVERMLTYDQDDLIPLSGEFRTRAGTPLLIEEPIWRGNLQMPF
ncbi:MAG: PIN domain-containing protein [Dehalococcoidia bacterium]|nr:PIN domain-containing protein [Dehalococcoidia bacterium]